jgi:hypothetical protein
LKPPQQRLGRMLDIAGISDAQRVDLSCRLDMRDAEGHIGMCMSNPSPGEPVAYDSRISHYAGWAPSPITCSMCLYLDV